MANLNTHSAWSTPTRSSSVPAQPEASLGGLPLQPEPSESPVLPGGFAASDAAAAPTASATTTVMAPVVIPTAVSPAAASDLQLSLGAAARQDANLASSSSPSDQAQPPRPVRPEAPLPHQRGGPGELYNRLGEAVAAQRTAEAALLEQATQHESAQRRIREYYENQLLEKTKEVNGLKSRVSALEAQSPKGRLLAQPPGASAVAAGLSPADVAQLRKDLDEQETLIRGFQSENEAAMRKIKELEEQVARANAFAAKETQRAERLGAQVAAMASGVAAPSAAMADPAASSRKHLQQILDLEKELMVRIYTHLYCYVLYCMPLFTYWPAAC